jgi:hypothetical protein
MGQMTWHMMWQFYKVEVVVRYIADRVPYSNFFALL